MNPFLTTPLSRPAAAALVLTLAAALAHAQPGGGLAGPGGPAGHGMMAGGPSGGPIGGPFGGQGELMLDLVNATDAQRSQIDAIFRAARQDLAGQRDTSQKLHQQMAALFAAPTIDAVAIEALRSQLSVQREIASKRMNQAAIEAARVLTPEQRAKMAEFMQKRQARLAARRGG